MKNLYVFHFNSTIAAMQVLSAILEDNPGSWGYLDSCRAYVVGDIIIRDDISVDDILFFESLCEVSKFLTGK